jgi:outer membrane protein assembly factor BamB
MRLKIFFTFLIMILPFLIFSENEKKQWSMLRGNPEGKGSISYSGDKELNEWHYIYKGSRRYEMGLAVWASPALSIIGGHPMAFIGGYDQTMHALDLVTKKAVWRKVTNGDIASAPAIGKVNGKDIVFWGSADRSVYAYNAFSGKKLWTKELIPPSTTLGRIFLSSPFIDEKNLYIACFAHDKSLTRNKQSGLLFKLDITTGAILWKLKVSSGNLSSPVGYEISGKKYLVIAARRGLVQCFDITGKKPIRTWKFQMPHEVMGSPVVCIELKIPMLFLGSKYGNLIAVNAVNGKEVWQRMAGNWIDNTACIGEIKGKKAVFAGSHDYRLYAFDAVSGDVIWKSVLGGEVYTAPCFFRLNEKNVVAVAALDNHIYVLDADNGKIISSFFTGRPIWDKVSKGETLWGSPAAVEAGNETVLIHGSFNDVVYTVPLAKECSLTAMARTSESLWWTLLVVFIIFTGVVLPVVLNIPEKKTDQE